MIAKNDIIQIVYLAIDEVNCLLPQDRRIQKGLTTILSGDKGGLDSLGLINLIVAVEQKLQEKSGVAVSLADERAMSQVSNPWQSVQTLVDYILVLTTT